MDPYPTAHLACLPFANNRAVASLHIKPACAFSLTPRLATVYLPPHKAKSANTRRVSLTTSFAATIYTSPTASSAFTNKLTHTCAPLMSLSARYQAFLARPSSDALVDNATLHYITTLTSISTAPAIVKHFTVQEKLLKKTGDKVLNAIESSNALSLEVETTIQFLNGGGAYLPGLDDNFIADRTVTFPMVSDCVSDCKHVC